jgi:hypothetical protein
MRDFFAGPAAHSESADEIKNDPQVPELQRAIYSRSPQSRAAMSLWEGGMSEGIQSGQSEAVDEQGGERKLLSWGGKY